MVGGKKAKCFSYRNSRTRPYYFRRCKGVGPTSIESLPDELLFDILVRLPAAHLHDEARFVCRRWSHIIHSSDFVNTQNRRSTYGLVLCSEAHQLLFCDNVLPLETHPIFLTATQEGQIERQDIRYTCKTQFYGSSNGLALDLSESDGFDDSLYISNPAINQELLLPPCSRDLCFHGNCGIGYVAASMEYKVALPYNVITSQGCRSQSLAILTVGVDNSWRDVRFDHLSEGARRLLLGYPVTTEGFIHWTHDNVMCFLTLDVETEILTVNRFPHCNLYTNNKFLSTGRSLSQLVSHRDFSWEVWVMESRNGEWSKLLPDIELGGLKCKLQQFACGDDDVLKPLGWVKYPEILAFYYHDMSCTCIFYNIATHEINSIQLRDSVRSFSATVHKNNLIWLS